MNPLLRWRRAKIHDRQIFDCPATRVAETPFHFARTVQWTCGNQLQVLPAYWMRKTDWYAAFHVTKAGRGLWNPSAWFAGTRNTGNPHSEKCSFKTQGQTPGKKMKQSASTTFRKRLRELRQTLRWTQKRTAKACGIGHKLYQLYEIGVKRNPGLLTLEKIAKGFHMEVHELLAPALRRIHKRSAFPKAKRNRKRSRHARKRNWCYLKEPFNFSDVILLQYFFCTISGLCHYPFSVVLKRLSAQGKFQHG